jgi:hypothetical protein
MHLHQMARFAAFQHAQGPMVDKPPQGRPHGFFAKPGALGQPRNRKAEPQLPFQPAVPHQVRVDRAIGEA